MSKLKNTKYKDMYLKEKIIYFLIDVVNKRDKSFKEKCIYFILLFLSKIYGWIVKIRLKFFNWGLLKHKTLGCLVISVGNITAGGTGKTPIVEVFARALKEEGRKVAVLTRGYRRKKAKDVKNDILVIKGNDSRSVYETGDEALLLSRNLKDIPVVIGKDRIISGEYAIKELGCDTLILDDGFQYLALNKRVNIVCIDANNPFGNGNLIPAGFLREPLDGLKRANMFFITKINNDTKNLDNIYEVIRKYNEEAPIIKTAYVPKGIMNISNGKLHPLDFAKNKKVVAVSAIADPVGFEKLLKENDINVVDHFVFPDHHFFTMQELKDVEKHTKNIKANMILFTEKDFVKLPDGFSFKIPAGYLKVGVKIIEGAENFTDCISKLCFT